MLKIMLQNVLLVVNEITGRGYNVDTFKVANTTLHDGMRITAKYSVLGAMFLKVANSISLA
jgi:hypothetical protein